MPGTITPVAQPNSAAVKPVAKVGGPAVQAPKPAEAAATPAVDYAAEQAKLKAGMDELSKQSARISRETQKLAAERRASQKEREDAKKWAQEREGFRVNPESLLKAELGDDYYDKLTNMRLAGGAPPAALIQTELQKLKADFEAKLAERDTKAAEAQQTAAQQRQENARKLLASDALEFAKQETNKAEPVVAAYGSPESFSASIAQRIETEYEKTGRVMSTKEAVDMVEKELFSLVEKVTATPKWQQRSKPTGEVVQQRRTLSNSTTGRTPGRAPPASEEERRARAEAAFEAAHRRNAGQ